jgi:hypothetical protein
VQLGLETLETLQHYQFQRLLHRKQPKLYGDYQGSVSQSAVKLTDVFCGHRDVAPECMLFHDCARAHCVRFNFVQWDDLIRQIPDCFPKKVVNVWNRMRLQQQEALQASETT